MTRSPSSSSSLVVNLARSGTATTGFDYSGVPGSITILANQASASFTLTPLDDALVEPDEAAIVTITASANYVVGSPDSATVTIHSEDITPTITITATDADASEPGSNTGSFTVTRNPVNINNLNVSLTRSGTAATGRLRSPYSTR